MGLDITAYRQITPAELQGFDLDGEPIADEAVRFCRNPFFEGRADDIDEGVAYTYADAHSFCAGAYSFYNRWRNELAKFAGYQPAMYSCFGEPETLRYDAGAWQCTSGTFWELIHFADNEGVIGTAVRTKLAKDFADFQSKADSHPAPYFRDLYNEWREAFEMAADSGAVDFH